MSRLFFRETGRHNCGRARLILSLFMVFAMIIGLVPAADMTVLAEEREVLKAGTYDIPVKLLKEDKSSVSMASAAVQSATFVVAEDGTTEVTLGLGTVNGVYASQWKYYTEDSCEDKSKLADTTPVKDADGNEISVTFTLPKEAYSWGGVFLQMSIGGGWAHNAYLSFDLSNVKSDDGTVQSSSVSHVKQFGEYDIDVTVTAKDEKILKIDVTGKNFSGQYVDNNKMYLNKAVEGLKDAYVGKSVKDVKEIEAVDSVSGATYSSNGIKDAIIKALGLEATKEVINVPSEKLKEGTYTVDISYTTDLASHSLVENEKNTAVINVDANGNMSLTTDIINGTTKEPLYVTQFNGYYADNDKTKELKKDAVVEKSAVDYEDDVFTAEDKAVTKVTLPLEGDYAVIYNTNAEIYVPIMKNLTGEISGVKFDRGKFSTDCFIKVYWDSLKKDSSSSSSSGSTLNLKDGTYTVTGSLYKPGMTSTSMSDTAIDHTMKLIVSGEKARLTMNFKGMDISGITGYIGSLSYYDTGYKMDVNGNPTGSLVSADVESVQKNSDGTIVSDDYGTNYPSVLSFDVIPEAFNDGIVPLQITVPVMEAIAPAAGAQNVYLKLDLNSIKLSETEKPSTNTNKAEIGTKVVNSGNTYKVISKEKVTLLRGKKNIKSITIPATVKVNGVKCKVTAVAANAFKNNKKLTNVTIGKYVTKVGNNAFKGCKKLKNIKFVNGVSAKTKKALKKQIIKAGAKGVKFK